MIDPMHMVPLAILAIGRLKEFYILISYDDCKDLKKKKK